MSDKKQQLLVTMNDGTQHVITIRNEDRVKFDQIAMTNGWTYPTKEDPRGAVLMMTYLAWHRMQKAGLYDGVWATFLTDHEDVEDANKANGTEAADLVPTQPDQSAEG